MDKELYVFLGAGLGALFAYVSAVIGARTQREVAQLNANKDITLQRDRLSEDRRKNELAVERGKLDALHRILSRIALENSQTMSHMQSSANLAVEDFRARYLENCDRLHEALAIVDIYYPEMRGPIRDIYGQSNVFWGYQENLLQTDIQTNPAGWNSHLSAVLKAGQAIGERAWQLQTDISHRAQQLSECLAQNP
jgi:hypothetical protein